MSFKIALRSSYWRLLRVGRSQLQIMPSACDMAHKLVQLSASRVACAGKRANKSDSKDSSGG
eukprot:3184643-Pyramimonas_sp.AAC.1